MNAYVSGLAKRTSYTISPDGVILAADSDLKPDRHVDVAVMARAYMTRPHRFLNVITKRQAFLLAERMPIYMLLFRAGARAQKSHALV